MTRVELKRKRAALHEEAFEILNDQANEHTEARKRCRPQCEYPYEPCPACDLMDRYDRLGEPLPDVVVNQKR